jgi:release factor glutamine methyltransferase
LNVEKALLSARTRLADADFEPALRDANLLLARTLDWSEAQVLARGTEEIASDLLAEFEARIDRRLAGEPVAYILGEKEFFGRDFFVDRRVLIPRPETEHLVEIALRLGLPADARVLDIGTGSGCLAVTLLAEITDCRAVATDISFAALRVAESNARRHGVEQRLELVATDLASAVSLQNFRLVVSNPPYIGLEEASTLSSEILEFEPGTALFAGPTGDSLLRRLLQTLSALQSGTPLLLEVGAGQSDAIAQLAEVSAFSLEEMHADLAGIDRIARLTRR